MMKPVAKFMRPVLFFLEKFGVENCRVSQLLYFCSPKWLRSSIE